jgi:hypothetical protein
MTGRQRIVEEVPGAKAEGHVLEERFVFRRPLECLLRSVSHNSSTYSDSCTIQ